ncbi:hypothetical protein R6Q57_024540 [Mikania cordata]
MQKADTNNGYVEFLEFVALVAPELVPTKSPYTDDQMKQLFKMFDWDGNRFITSAELAHSMAWLVVAEGVGAVVWRTVVGVIR